MHGQKPMTVQKTRGFCKRNGSTQQIVQHHKAIHATLQLSGFDPRCDQAHIHGDAAQLKRKVPPGVAVIHHREIIKELLGDIPFDLFDENETDYICDCSRERTGRALYSLPIKDIDEMIADGEDVEMTCRFCDKKYIFTIDELRELRDKKQ